MRLPHCIAVFFILPRFVDVYGKKVVTSKIQCNTENACGNRMWQLGLSHFHTSRCLLLPINDHLMLNLHGTVSITRIELLLKDWPRSDVPTFSIVFFNCSNYLNFNFFLYVVQFFFYVGTINEWLSECERKNVLMPKKKQKRKKLQIILFV